MVVMLAGIIRARNLFVVVILGSAYSFLMATVLVVLDAVDVAMTEAAVGAGISTVLLLSVLHLTRTRAAPLRRPPVIPIVVRSEEHTSELQSLMRISYAAFCLKK